MSAPTVHDLWVRTPAEDRARARASVREVLRQRVRATLFRPEAPPTLWSVCTAEAPPPPSAAAAPWEVHASLAVAALTPF